MKLLRLLTPCLFFYSFFSCKKSDVLVVDAGTSYYKSNVNAGITRVFAYSGEIKDPGIVSRYTANDNFYFETISDPYNYSSVLPDSVVFIDPLHAVISKDHTTYTCNVLNKFPYLICNRPDTIRQLSYGEQYTRQIAYNIVGIKPQVFDENIYSSSGNNYNFSYSSIEKFVLIPEKNQLTAPLLQVIVHGTQGIYSTFQFFRLNNVLQHDFYLRLLAGDTVVLSEYRVFFKKQ